jgi:hypothetical protein
MREALLAQLSSVLERAADETDADKFRLLRAAAHGYYVELIELGAKWRADDIIRGSGPFGRLLVTKDA